jgi:hypothetical protein
MGMLITKAEITVITLRNQIKTWLRSAKKQALHHLPFNLRVAVYLLILNLNVKASTY